MATWPMSQDYNEAIQHPTDCFTDPELKQGEAVTNRLGLPVPCSGNFADVYAMTSGPRKWAVKCFTRQIPGLKERYVEVSKYLQQVPLPFMVDFRFLEQGILVRGQWFPILKMQWVEGLALNAFVRENLDKPQILDALCQIWLKLASRLREANLAHCDLQHGNVLMVQGASAGKMGVKLVDYDGTCVPALELLKSIELGHPAYQHPQRLREGTYGLEIDRFPHLVIYTAIRAIMAGGKGLWKKYDNGDNLLFRQTDFEAPRTSALFQELLKLNDPEVKKLAQAVAIASQNPIDRVPLLDQLVEAPKPKPAPPTVPVPAQRRTGVGQPTASATANPFAGVADENASFEPTRYRGRRKRGLMMASLAVIALMLGAPALYFGLRPKPRPQPVELAQVVVKPEIPTTKGQPAEPPNQPATAQRPKTKPDTRTTPRPDPEFKLRPEPKLEPKPEPEPVAPDAKTPELIATLPAFTGEVGHLTFSPDGKSLAFVGYESAPTPCCRINVWEMASGRNIATQKELRGVRSLALSPNGKTLAWGLDWSNGKRRINIWDLASDRNITVSPSPNSEIACLSFSPDGKSLASGERGGAGVDLWDTVTGKNVAALNGRLNQHIAGIRAVAFSTDGKILAAAGSDVRNGQSGMNMNGSRARQGFAVRLWDVASRRHIATHGLDCSGTGVTKAVFSPDGKTLATSSFLRMDKPGVMLNVIDFWNVADGKKLGSTNGSDRYYLDALVFRAYPKTRLPSLPKPCFPGFSKFTNWFWDRLLVPTARPWPRRAGTMGSSFGMWPAARTRSKSREMLVVLSDVWSSVPMARHWAPGVVTEQSSSGRLATAARQKHGRSPSSLPNP